MKNLQFILKILSRKEISYNTKWVRQKCSGKKWLEKPGRSLSMKYQNRYYSHSHSDKNFLILKKIIIIYQLFLSSLYYLLPLNGIKTHLTSVVHMTDSRVWGPHIASIPSFWSWWYKWSLVSTLLILIVSDVVFIPLMHCLIICRLFFLPHFQLVFLSL